VCSCSTVSIQHGALQQWALGQVCMLCTRIPANTTCQGPSCMQEVHCNCNNTQQIVSHKTHKTPHHGNHSSRPEDCWNRTVTPGVSETAVPVSSLQHFKMTWSYGHSKEQ